MKKRSPLETVYERAINLIVSLYYGTTVPLAHWKLSPITGRLFYSNGTRTPPRLPAVEWSQCRKSHDHRRKITRNPVCWKIQVLLDKRSARQIVRIYNIGSDWSSSSYLFSFHSPFEIVSNNVKSYILIFVQMLVLINLSKKLIRNVNI